MKSFKRRKLTKKHKLLIKNSLPVSSALYSISTHYIQWYIIYANRQDSFCGSRLSQSPASRKIGCLAGNGLFSIAARHFLPTSFLVNGVSETLSNQRTVYTMTYFSSNMILRNLSIALEVEKSEENERATGNKRRSN